MGGILIWGAIGILFLFMLRLFFNAIATTGKFLIAVVLVLVILTLLLNSMR